MAGLFAAATVAACSGVAVNDEYVGNVQQKLGTFSYYSFHSQDSRGFNDGDWSPGNYKGQCAQNDAATGLAIGADLKAKRLQCENGRGAWTWGSATVNPQSGDDRRDGSTGDWNFGNYKGECGQSEAVIGVSRGTSDGNIKHLRCAPVSGGAPSSCYARTIDAGDNRGRTSQGDWEQGSYKGECADGEWIKGVSVTPSTGKAHAILCCGGGGGGGSGIASVLSEAQFNSFFPERNAVYTYANLVNAANQVGFAMEADMTIRKRHVAAILASMAHEADYLRATREYSSCSSPPYSCPYGWYFGRGAIQLSWASNYQAFGNWLGLGNTFVDNAELVATDGVRAFQSSTWYYMTQNGPGGYGGHCKGAMDASNGAGGYGECIRHINGALECNGGNPAQVENRVNLYRGYCNALGVSYGEHLYC
jgi:Chitinase class I